MSDLFNRLKNALADRYAIERELGAGGMATVYLAQDVKHERQVAVKVLRPELAAAIGPERFLREIKTTAQLNHPHILPLLDSGDADGFLYYVMPFMEGESLRDRLDREKQLSVEDALRVAREVADALHTAHQRDVVHRDIKPENILIEAGHAVIADFGIARAIQASGGDQLTETGLAVGTPSYMSPEQAAGSRDLDGRSDIYALGCVVYELLAGEPPFTGATVESVVHQHVAVQAPPVTNLRPGVSPGIAAALSRALAKTPADRFGTAREFADALTQAEVTTATETTSIATPSQWRTGAIAAAVLLIVAAGLWGIARIGGSAAGGEEALPRLVVLPLENLGAAEDEYFAAGMTEEITSRLAGISGLRVIARQTAIQYKGSDKSAAEIARELDVDYVLEGTVRTDRAPDGTGQVRITPQLIRASDESHVWAEASTVDLVPGEIFRIQAEVAERIAQSMNVVLLEPEREVLAARPTENLEAYERFLRGNYYVAQRTGDALSTAVTEYEASSRADPGFIQPLSRVGYAYALLYGWGWEYQGLPPESLQARGMAAADRAIREDPENSDAWMARGYLLTQVNAATFEGVRDAFERSITLNPRNAEAHHIYGWALGVGGDDSAAERHLQHALAIDPRRLITLSSLAQMSFRAGRLDETQRWADSAIAIDPGYWFAYTWRARVRLLRGQIGEGRADAELARRLSAGDGAYAATTVALAALRDDDLVAAGEFIDEALSLLNAPSNTSVVAIALVGLDDERALRLLESVPVRGQLFWSHLRVPEYDPIRNTPRFQALFER
ncbi:MAG: protein kinase [Gemmatimonadetes bacterium]|nr:protein kinase [Gemmatimonadota bacterium]